MELDIIAHPGSLQASQAHAQEVEAAGFGSVWWTDSGRSAYLAATASALATDRLQIGTGIAVAFPRSPMVTAGIAWELAASTGGRFVLGLGSQVKAHIERRYSSEFAPPGPRMKEYVESVKAIFRAFSGVEKLSYEGEFYHFSLLPSTWSPGPIEVEAPPVYISAVLPYMSRLVGEVADGIHVHPFHSPEYVKDVQGKAIAKGLARSGRTLDDITFSCPIMTAVGDTDEELSRTREHSRMMIAFYGSTRTYSPVFEHHGHHGLSDELHGLQKRGDIPGMQALITDDVLEHYTVTSNWNDLAGKLVDRYRDLAPNVRVTSYTAADQWSNPAWREKWSQVTATMRAAG
ncbi:MAG: TIGR03617 family F420-dependent LLM class oxidoreductase [bacterium]|nr:LLM class F420-dependent oxidoreductase [Deltaproteobacteria bacterium]MCP4905849.1 TIGR03617 family F420-dependent LLM class oxidoreductase [bacterium]